MSLNRLSEITNKCIICNGQSSDIIEAAGVYKILQCKDCGLVFIDPIPSKEVLDGAYSDDYYTPWINEQRGKRIRMWEKRLEILNKFSQKKGRLLDVGCGEGLFLELARKDAWDVTGTEVSSFAVQYGKDRLGLDVFQGELTDVGFKDKSFDAITMWHVLEHAANPIVVLNEIRRIIREDGVFILAVPNFNNIISQWAYRLVKGKRMHLFSPQDRELHLYHFTPATIRLSLEKAGFRVIKIIPDMGIIQWHIRSLNYIAGSLSFLSGQILTDAMEIHAIPKRDGE